MQCMRHEAAPFSAAHAHSQGYSRAAPVKGCSEAPLLARQGWEKAGSSHTAQCCWGVGITECKLVSFLSSLSQGKLRACRAGKHSLQQVVLLTLQVGLVFLMFTRRNMIK